jgi:transcriptional regulator with PAS, ATPase and Fis domain
MNPELWSLAEDGGIESLLREAASTEGAPFRAFRNVAEVLSQEEPAAGIILAIDGTGKYKNYATIIKRIQKNFFGTDIVVFGVPKTSEAGDRERALGVDLYVPVPPRREDFFSALAETVAIRRVKTAAGVIGRSREINEMLEMVLRVAPTDAPVLIEGESGSGKELTARAIHLMSKRRDRSFEAVNCGALAEGVLESELFGHERGSFTGAVARRQGLFERANRGTLFLDEVGEMSLNMQVRLLRVIETGEFLRVGGVERVRTDVRIIAATNRSLEAAVERGEFRKDLYYRLKVVQIRIPPLRARPDDIPLLVHYLLAQASRKHGKKIRGIERQGMDLLLNYPWPGNVRELANVIDNLTILGREGVIRADEVDRRLREKVSNQTFPDLPVHVPKSREEVERELILNSLLSLHNDIKEVLGILRGEGAAVGGRWRGLVEIKEADEAEPRNLERIERDAIREALAANGGNRRKAAKQLGLSERTLYRRIKEYKIG